MSANKQPFSAAESLKIALRNAGLESDADRIFFSWPALHTVALNFCRYVSPFIELDGGCSLLEAGLRDAVEGFKEYEETDMQKAMHGFIKSFAGHVDGLCCVRLSVQTDDGSWVIWQYDQPVQEWMFGHGRKAVQIRRREEPIEKGPVLLKLLSYICSVRDLQAAGLDLKHLI